MTWIVIGVVVLLVLLLIFLYNRLVRLRNRIDAAWSQIDVQLKRRYDLIPNLVETVRGAAAQERNVLREVTEARASANRIQVTGEQLTDPQPMARFAAAQARLTLSLQRLQEAYPELRSNENFLTLQAQLEGTENRIARSRERYNEAVQAYNTRIRTFPDLIGARIIYGSDPMVPFQAQEGAEQAPRVDFGNRQ